MGELATVAEPVTELKESSRSEQIDTQPSLIGWKTIWKPLSVIAGVFLVFFWLPIDSSRFTGAVIESLALAKWYAQEHVLLCLVPAFFIAGAISVFVSQAAVMKYLGAGARKVMSYGIGGLLLHGTATVCRYLEARCGTGSGDSVFVFRTGHQCTGDRAHRPDPWP
jgi:hypothetical protein